MGQVFLFTIIFTSGCTKKPVELIQKAEEAISQAKQADAEKWAPNSFKTAQETFTTAMSFVNEKKYKSAIQELNSSLQYAEISRKEAIEAKRLAESKKDTDTYNEHVNTINNENIKNNVQYTTHTVRRGECLWIIARYTKTYGDAWKWRKIYDANKGKIRNPDLIYPGQTFEIPK